MAPAAKKKTDLFVNMYEVSLTMSAANTLSFQEINLGLTLFDKVGLIVSRIEYEVPDASWNQIIAAADKYQVAICSDNQISDLNFSNRALVDMTELQLCESAAGQMGQIMRNPLVQDYSTLPGGGLLIAPKPLYLAMNTTGFASEGGVNLRMYFQIMNLTPSDYFELLESRRYFG